MGKAIKIFFVTDIHGSNTCYRKFLNALKAYNVDVGILLGDLTGKVLVPLIEKPGGGWETTLMGTHTEVATPGRVGQAEENHRDDGLLLGTPNTVMSSTLIKRIQSRWMLYSRN